MMRLLLLGCAINGLLLFFRVSHQKNKFLSPTAPPSSQESLVSIAVLTYGYRVGFMRQALQQISMQTYPLIEVVVVDDSPTPVKEGLSSELKALAECDGDAECFSWNGLTVRIVRLLHRSSIGAKRQAALHAARGDIVMHWDDDDMYPTTRVETQARPILRGEAALTIFPMTYALNLPDGEFFRNPNPPSTPLMHFGTLTYSRSMALSIGGFEDITQSEDLRFAETALLSCNWLLMIPDGEMAYSRHAGVGSANNTFFMPDRLMATLYGKPRHRVEAPEWVTAAMLANLIGAEQQSLHNRGNRTSSKKVNDYGLPRISPWVDATKMTPRMHPTCCSERDDPRCNMPRHRVAVLVTGVLQRFIPMSTLHRVVAPARKAGFEVDYFADLSSTRNVSLDSALDPAFHMRSDSEIKDFVKNQAMLLGARHAHVSLAPRDKSEQVHDGRAFSRYKSVERLWAVAKEHAGTYNYDTVVVLRDDSFWTAEIDTTLLHASSIAGDDGIAYSLNCGQRFGHNDNALLLSGKVADDVLSMYTAWQQDLYPQLHHMSNAEEFLKKLAEIRLVPWEEVGSDRLPVAVASHIKAPDAEQPVLCMAQEDACGIATSASQQHPFC
jgi:hypothetical protein